MCHSWSTQPAGCGVAGQRTCFGSTRSSVRIRPPRPPRFRASAGTVVAETRGREPRSATAVPVTFALVELGDPLAEPRQVLVEVVRTRLPDPSVGRIVPLRQPHPDRKHHRPRREALVPADRPWLVAQRRQKLGVHRVDVELLLDIRAAFDPQELALRLGHPAPEMGYEVLDAPSVRREVAGPLALLGLETVDEVVDLVEPLVLAVDRGSVGMVDGNGG